MRNRAEHALSSAKGFYCRCPCCPRHQGYRQHLKRVARRARRQTAESVIQDGLDALTSEREDERMCECMGGLAGPCPYGDDDGTA